MADEHSTDEEPTTTSAETQPTAEPAVPGPSKPRRPRRKAATVAPTGSEAVAGTVLDHVELVEGGADHVRVA